MTENNSHVESESVNVSEVTMNTLPPAAMALPAAPSCSLEKNLAAVVAAFSFSDPARAGVEGQRIMAVQHLSNLEAKVKAASEALAAIDEQLEAMPENEVAKESLQLIATTALARGSSVESVIKMLSYGGFAQVGTASPKKAMTPPGEQRIQHVPEKVQNVCLTSNVVEQIEALVRSAGQEGIEARKVTAAFSYLPKPEVFKVLKNIVASHRGQQEGATVARKYWFNPGE